MVEIKNVIKSLHLVSGAKNKSNSFFYLFAAPREKAGGGVGGGELHPSASATKQQSPFPRL